MIDFSELASELVALNNAKPTSPTKKEIMAVLSEHVSKHAERRIAEMLARYPAGFSSQKSRKPPTPATESELNEASLEAAIVAINRAIDDTTAEENQRNQRTREKLASLSFPGSPRDHFHHVWDRGGQCVCCGAVRPKPPEMNKPALITEQAMEAANELATGAKALEKNALYQRLKERERTEAHEAREKWLTDKAIEIGKRLANS